MMIDVVLCSLVLLVFVPVIVYLSVKCGRVAYLRGTRFFRERESKDGKK